jgi:hypothetical protein
MTEPATTVASPAHRAEGPPPRPRLVLVAGHRSGVAPFEAWLATHPDVAWIGPDDYADVDGDASSFPRNTREPGYTRDPAMPDAFASIAHRLERRLDRAVGCIGWRPGYAVEVPHVLWHAIEHLPDARFLFCLRHPVAAAWHRYHAARDRMPGTFDEAVETCLERMESVGSFERRGRWPVFLEDPDPVAMLLQGGVYAPAVSRTRRLVGPERVHVVTYEAVVRDPAAHRAAILDFLRLRPDDPSPPPPGAPPLDDVDIAPETRRRLERFYAPPDARLAEILEWSRAPWT